MILHALHPLTRLAAWLVTALAVPSLHAPALAAGVIALAVFGIRESDVGRGWLRSRWLFVSLLIVYVGVDPATMRWGFYAEGINAAIEQIARLAIMIGLLAVLFPKRAVDELVYAIYLVLKPLRRLGISAERIALRIGLTMQFAMREQSRDLLSRLESEHTIDSASVLLHTRPIRHADYLFGIILTALVMGLYA